jgi:hypothetical protein
MNLKSQFITNYTLHQTTSDTTTYIDHLEQYKSLYGFYPKESIADAGYGSEENYLYAQGKGISTPSSSTTTSTRSNPGNG